MQTPATSTGTAESASTPTPASPTQVDKPVDIVSPNVVKANTPGKHLSYVQRFVQRFVAPELSASSLKKFGNQIFAEFRALNDWAMSKLCAEVHLSWPDLNHVDFDKLEEALEEQNVELLKVDIGKFVPQVPRKPLPPQSMTSSQYNVAHSIACQKSAQNFVKALVLGSFPLSTKQLQLFAPLLRREWRALNDERLREACQLSTAIDWQKFAQDCKQAGIEFLPINVEEVMQSKQRPTRNWSVMPLSPDERRARKNQRKRERRAAFKSPGAPFPIVPPPPDFVLQASSPADVPEGLPVTTPTSPRSERRPRGSRTKITPALASFIGVHSPPRPTVLRVDPKTPNRTVTDPPVLSDASGAPPEMFAQALIAMAPAVLREMKEVPPPQPREDEETRRSPKRTRTNKE